MGICIQKIVDQVPVISLANMAVKYLRQSPLAKKDTSSTDSAIASIFTGIISYFVYPRIAPIAGLINVSVGGVHLGFALIQRFKTADNQEEKWKSVAHNIHKGFVHLIAAGYDVGIGLLLKRKYFCFAAVLMIAKMPNLVTLWHQRLFRKPEDERVTDAQIPASVQMLMARLNNFIPPVFAGFMQPLVEAADGQGSETPTYLSKTCFIYSVAKKFTLELIPSEGAAQQAGSLWESLLNTSKRLLGMSAGQSLPDHGL